MFTVEAATVNSWQEHPICRSTPLHKITSWAKPPQGPILSWNLATMPQSSVSRQTNYSKLIAMIIFLTVDLGLNSILDYDLFNNQTAPNNASHLLLGLLGFQAVVEICTFLVLFVAMADTFLFRVGLLGLLMRKFRTILIFQPIYIAITLASGALRVRHLSVVGNSLFTLYNYNPYVRLSLIQKICEYSKNMLRHRIVRTCMRNWANWCHARTSVYVTHGVIIEQNRFHTRRAPRRNYHCLYIESFLLSNHFLFRFISFNSSSVAIPYYLLNLRATIKLGHPIYYNKEAWVALIKQVNDYGLMK